MYLRSNHGKTAHQVRRVATLTGLLVLSVPDSIPGSWPCIPSKNCFKNPDGGIRMIIKPEDYDETEIPELYPPRHEDN